MPFFLAFWQVAQNKEKKKRIRRREKSAGVKSITARAAIPIQINAKVSLLGARVKERFFFLFFTCSSCSRLRDCMMTSAHSPRAILSFKFRKMLALTFLAHIFHCLCDACDFYTWHLLSNFIIIIYIQEKKNYEIELYILYNCIGNRRVIFIASKDCLYVCVCVVTAALLPRVGYTFVM